MYFGCATSLVHISRATALQYKMACSSHMPRLTPRFPGKERMEPLGVIVFSCVMATAAFSVIIEGIKQLASKDTGADGLSNQWIIIGGTILMVTMKALLYMYCRGSKSASVAAFATDHLNDTIVNSFSLAGALLGAHVEWWLDPAIAIGLSLWVMWSWGRQGWEQLVNLVSNSNSYYAFRFVYKC